MKFLRNTSFVILFSLSLLNLSSAASDWQKIKTLLDPAVVLAEAGMVTQTAYPDADAVLVNDLVHEYYNPDGTGYSLDDEYTKIMTEKGRRNNMVRSYWFQQHYGTATVVRAEIFKPDGARIEIDLNSHTRVMIDPGQMNANIYDPNMKILQLSLPGLEIGDVCHIVTRREIHKARVPDTWCDYNVFEADAPIRNLTYEVSSPNSRPLKHLTVRDPVTNTLTYLKALLPEDRTLHSWKVQNVPQLYPEPNMPALHTVAQRLILSTANDWPTISRWYWNLCKPRLDAITPDMAPAVSNIVAGATSREERLQRIFKFVSQNIRYMGITTEETAPGYEPHDVSITFKNRYGVCRDKAALLVTLLRMDGFEAYPVLIHAGAKMDPDAPIPYFNHAIVAIAHDDNTYQLMDPTNENTRDLLPAYLCNRSYLVAHPKGEVLRVSEVDPAENNLLRIATTGNLDNNGTLNYKTELVFEGINDTLYRGHFVRLKPDERRKFFENLAKSRSAGAELTSFEILPTDLQDITRKLTVSFSCRVRDWPIRGDGTDVATLPWFGAAIGYVNFVVGNTGLKTRRFPLETEVACGVKETVEIALADGMGKLKALPQKISFDRSGIAFDSNLECNSNLLKGSQKYLVRKAEFTPAEYLDLRQSLRDIEYAGRQRPLFESLDNVKPDARVLRDDVTIELLSADSWINTHTVERQILTYAGTKRFAELKVAFNPVWQNAELVSAVVSNLDGKVHTVVPVEINIMDATWAGSAPRYPAGKTMVVSLPGVEVGSVINSTIRVTHNKAPFFSIEHNFGGFEPVEEASLTIIQPSNVKLSLCSLHANSLSFSTEYDTVNGNRILKWNGTGLTAVRKEDSLPRWGLYQPTVIATTGDWDKYIDALQYSFNQNLRNQKMAQSRAKSILANVPNRPALRIQALRNDVLRNIRLAGPQFFELPLSYLTPADQTLSDGYGHQADRMILLAAMLQSSGFKADPILAASSPNLPEELFKSIDMLPSCKLYAEPLLKVAAIKPQRSFNILGPGFSGMAGAVPPLFIGDGDQYNPLNASAFHRHPYLRLDNKTNRDVTVPSGRVLLQADYVTRSKADWTIILDHDGTATITATNWFFGAACGEFRRQYDEMSPEERRRHHLELIGEVSQSGEAVGELITDTSNYPGYRAFTLKAERYAVINDNLVSLMLPGAPNQILPLRADNRENPLFNGKFNDVEWSCRVILPENTKRLTVQPPSFEWQLPNQLGSVTADSSASMDGAEKEVLFTRKIETSASLLEPELYPSLLEFNRKLQHPRMRMLVAETSEIRE